MMFAAVASRRFPAAICRSTRVLAVVPSSASPAGVGLWSSSSHGKRAMSDLPYHIVMGMPALSPTMEAGSISSWTVAEGESFMAGDSLAEIETDKATIAFEAQDDGVVAKHLVTAGDGAEIIVGTAILVVVEEPEDVAAFSSFVAPVEEAAAPAPVAVLEPPKKAPEPVVAAAPTPEPVVVATPPPAPVAVAPVVPEPVAVPLPSAAAAPTTVGPAWGYLARTASPLAKMMSREQKAYIAKYGSTGQLPL
uniref:Lipoyl-binding domain-containing protein n=1 Tax=Attheya septentrionalis TaxID=420275 RepID=A0A6T7HJN7_9STRA|mmetsp:Transcript_20898/g.37729  ORF Transcript_20898/g.37729 Transcript_20898/m.37729 type:complete len:250 (+) Transcript_20898:87-836(+)